jgi:hypothetical protein
MAKASQRQIVAEIRPVRQQGHRNGPRVDGKFAQVSGGEITANVEKIYDGGALTPEVLCAPAEIGDITVTRHFDDIRDAGPLRSLRQAVGQVYYDVSIFTLDCDLEGDTPDRVYHRALLVGISEPDGDSASGAPATFSLTFSVGAVAADTQ